MALRIAEPFCGESIEIVRRAAPRPPEVVILWEQGLSALVATHARQPQSLRLQWTAALSAPRLQSQGLQVRAALSAPRLQSQGLQVRAALSAPRLQSRPLTQRASLEPQVDHCSLQALVLVH
jgi:hypothetical protein